MVQEGKKTKREVLEESVEKRKVMLKIIKEYLKEHAYPPTVREVGTIIGLKSVATVQKHLYILEREGYITRERTIPRSIRIIKDFKVEEGTEELVI